MEFNIAESSIFETYEIMTPESVGVKQTSLVMGKHSGRRAFIHKLKDLGYELSGNQFEDAQAMGAQ